MKVRVNLTLKHAVLDPEGPPIPHAPDGPGFAAVEAGRAGKLIGPEPPAVVPAPPSQDTARRLLANTVIENYRIERA